MSVSLIDGAPAPPPWPSPQGGGEKRGTIDKGTGAALRPRNAVHVGGKFPPSVIPGRAEGASPGPINTGASDSGAGVPGS